MNPSDTFAVFLSGVADCLDDHAVDSDALAGRLHLSRSHLDRLVAAASGETPARFRRRVLLERAAFRLLDTHTGILDVAVEAGYGSHEAFTRAFTRAYGQTPQAWRQAPTAVLLAAPSGVHFHPPAGLRMPARHHHEGSEASSMDLVSKMVEHHVWLLGELVSRAGTVDGRLLDRPVPAPGQVDDDPTVRSLLSRLIGQMDMWNQALALRDYDWDVERNESLAGMRDRLGEVGPAFLTHVRQAVAEGRLDDTFVHAQCSPPQVYTYGGLIAHVLTFAAYRRTVVVGALADAGVGDLNFGDPRDWVAEH
ncbi:helix-turn-helix transcriptional regulator [Actinoplanes sp. NPDC048791]|uniref:helix-turn-helix transcriptional regulator n=1 Tax=Actinoplanes sp. NPDC048791 TaxID=3154623 RepID=UPI0033E36E2A